MKGSTKNWRLGDELNRELKRLSKAEADGLRATVIDWLVNEDDDHGYVLNLRSAVHLSDASQNCIDGMSSLSPSDKVKNGENLQVKHLVENHSVYPIWIQQNYIFETNVDFDDCDDGLFRDDQKFLCDKDVGIEQILELSVSGSAGDGQSFIDVSGFLEAVKVTAKGLEPSAQRQFRC